MDNEQMKPWEKIELGIILTLLAIMIFLAFASWPVQAATLGDTFSTDTTSDYNQSLSWFWNATSEEVEYRNLTSRINSQNYPYKNEIFGYGKYRINSTLWLYYGSGGYGYQGLQFGGGTQETIVGTTRGGGNGYFAFFRYTRTLTGGNISYLTRWVAGAETVLNISPAYAITDNTFPYKISNVVDYGYPIRYNAIYEDQTNEIISWDSTYREGYSGPFRSSTYWTSFDDFYINETPTASFTCSGTACTQTGENFGDPGTVSRWIWDDGTTTEAINVTAPALPGTRSVSLLLDNIAGSSSVVRRDYLTTATVQTLELNPSIRSRCPWWHFGFWC